MPSVLVTGAGRGIGLAITEHMSRRGWEVYATARSDDALQSLDRLPNVHAIPLDITDRSSITALSDRLPAELNGVVNNAGIIVNGPVEGLALDDLTRQFEVNVIAQIAVTQAVLPRIRASQGRVVFISSVSGLYTTPGTGAYNASKYAIESLADALRMELRPWRIPVSLIEPGPIRTDMWADVLADHDRMADHLSAQSRPESSRRHHPDCGQRRGTRSSDHIEVSPSCAQAAVEPTDASAALAPVAARSAYPRQKACPPVEFVDGRKDRAHQWQSPHADLSPDWRARLWPRLVDAYADFDS